MSWIVVMLTTAGVTFATSVATSGVPGRTGGVANGAGAAGTVGAASGALGGVGFAAWAKCLWQPAPVPSAAARKMGPNFRFVMAEPLGSNRKYLPLAPAVKFRRGFAVRIR